MPQFHAMCMLCHPTPPRRGPHMHMHMHMHTYARQAAAKVPVRSYVHGWGEARTGRGGATRGLAGREGGRGPGGVQWDHFECVITTVVCVPDPPFPKTFDLRLVRALLGALPLPLLVRVRAVSAWVRVHGGIDEQVGERGEQNERCSVEGLLEGNVAQITLERTTNKGCRATALWCSDLQRVESHPRPTAAACSLGVKFHPQHRGVDGCARWGTPLRLQCAFAQCRGSDPRMDGAHLCAAVSRPHRWYPTILRKRKHSR